MRTACWLAAPLLIVLGASPALAAWPNLSTVNLPVCTAANIQIYPTIVSDGTGGAIVTWQDQRSGPNDIYAQHLLASGAADPAWPANGRALCTVATANHWYPTIASDGAGGAIVTWEDYGSDPSGDIYAQHVLASGVVDPAWPANGRALCTAIRSQYRPMIVSDGAGGAIVTWYDIRGAVAYDIYAQHVLAAGTVDPAWPVDGRALCTAAGGQVSPTIATDGGGGAIVTWEDGRVLGTTDIYAQHVLASGVLDPAWPVDGRALCTAPNNQQAPTIVGDGSRGAIVTWNDQRSGASGIYAQHVLASGAADPGWPVGGRALCAGIGTQPPTMIASDGAGGAIVTWCESRPTNTGLDIYAQHMLSSGVVDPAWPENGRALCTAIYNQYFPTIVGDGAGGAIVTWYDTRSGGMGPDMEIYAQHVLASGAVDPAWPSDGRALCTATNEQSGPQITSDGAGGAIVAWYDLRGGVTSDIYAQRVEPFGHLGNPEPVLAGARDVPNDQGGHVKVSWAASYLDAMPYAGIGSYQVWRSIPPAVAQARLVGGANLARAGAPFSIAPGGAVRFTGTGGQAIAWEYVGSEPSHRFASYSFDVPTTGDSVAGSNPLTQVLVSAVSTDNQTWWDSAPAAGYSVDNLPPATPAAFNGTYAAGSAALTWGRSAAPDLAGYRLYRGASAAFTPSSANLVATLTATSYTDAAAGPCYYKLTAVDWHGNESMAAALLPGGTAGVGNGAVPHELALSPASPNPASRGTTLRFALPADTHVSLGIFDAAGRLVRALAGGALPAGEHAAAWDLRDTGGHNVGAGLYFARLEAGGRTLVRRVAVTP